VPRRCGIEACRELKEHVPTTRIIVLAMSDEESDLYQAVRAGANGYLLKDVPGEEIADGLLAVQSGQSLISPSMAAQLLSEFASTGRMLEQGPAELPPKLTAREAEVLQLLARGLANKTIAAKLVISENTVKSHVRTILDKLQKGSRMEEAMYAVREKLVEVAGPSRTWVRDPPVVEGSTRARTSPDQPWPAHRRNAAGA